MNRKEFIIIRCNREKKPREWSLSQDFNKGMFFFFKDEKKKVKIKKAGGKEGRKKTKSMERKEGKQEVRKEGRRKEAKKEGGKEEKALKEVRRWKRKDL